LLQVEPAGVERGVATIAQRPTDRRTVPPDDLGFRIGPVLDGPLDRPYPTYPLAQFLLRVPISLPNRPAGFPQVMKLTELMRDVGKNVSDRLPQRQLPIADHPHHREVFQSRHGRLEKQAQLVATGRQQATGQQDVSRQHLPHHPEDFMALVRLQAIHRQNQPTLLVQAGALRWRRQHHTHQLLIPPQQMVDRARRDHHAPPGQRPMNLGHRTMILVPTGPNPGDHVQAKRVMGQRQPPLQFRSVRSMVKCTGRIHAAPNLQRDRNYRVQGRDRAGVVIGKPERSSTHRTASVQAA
jgi:hypothetical protein